jgi:hypothetical protein
MGAVGWMPFVVMDIVFQFVMKEHPTVHRMKEAVKMARR